MRRIQDIFSFGRSREEQIRERLDQALHSLRARGSIDSFLHDGSSGILLQWNRGNFGHRLRVDGRRRHWTLTATPITNPAGPFVSGSLVGEIVPLAEWTRCGTDVSLERAHEAGHLALIEWIRNLEHRHPAGEWLGGQFKRLAEGEHPDQEELQGVVLLGVRRFLKTIPSADRLHETIEPAVQTLLRIRSKTRSSGSGDEHEVFASEDYAASLIALIQETHPLEAKRAAQRYMSSR